MEVKKCTKCLKEKPLDTFRIRKRLNKNGEVERHSRCNVCEKKSNLSRYYKKYKGNNHRLNGYKYLLKTKYSLNVDQFNKMYENVQGCCPICKEKIENIFLSTKGKDCAVDHCHDTGSVRGLLCRTCNSGIGQLKDSKELLRNAIKYLEEKGYT